MEFIAELIFEIIFEGCIELSSSKKVPWPLRILAALIFVGFYGVFIFVLCAVGVDLWQENKKGGAVFFFAVSLLLFFGIIYLFIKKRREKNND